MAQLAAERLTADDLASLPDDIREEIARQEKGVKPERKVSAAAALPPGERDETLVEILVLAHNAPWGEVAVAEKDAKGKPVNRIEQRPLKRKERVKMPRWCADLMVANDHVVII